MREAVPEGGGGAEGVQLWAVSKGRTGGRGSVVMSRVSRDLYGLGAWGVTSFRQLGRTSGKAINNNSSMNATHHSKDTVRKKKGNCKGQNTDL